MKSLQTIFTSIILLAYTLSSHAADQFDLVGTWEGDQNGSIVTLVFTDNTVSMYLGSMTEPLVSGPYTMDQSISPIHLDIKWDGEKEAQTIMEFRSMDELLMADPKPSRPLTFDEKPIRFIRVEDHKAPPPATTHSGKVKIVGESTAISLTRSSSVQLDPEKGFRVYEKFSITNALLDVDFKIYASTNKVWHFPALSPHPTIRNKSKANIAVSVNFLCLSEADEVICTMYQGTEVLKAEKHTQLASCMSMLPAEAIAKIKKYKITVYTEPTEATSAIAKLGIHYHAQSGNLNVVKELLKKDPSLLDSKTEYGKTPLLWAVTTAREEAIDYLTDQGANINATDKFGAGALHLAAEYNHPELITKFINLGLDIHMGNNDGETPLHEAARCGNAETIKALLEAKAEVNRENNFGHTAMDKAYLSRGLFKKKDSAFYKDRVRQLDEAISLLESAGGITKRKQ